MSKEKSQKQSSQQHVLPPKYKLTSWAKKDEQFRRIPQEWRITVDPKATSYMDLPRSCGLLTAAELRITEEYDAVGLAEAIREKRLKCVDVARAFCKRAAISHQATNCLTEIFFRDAITRAQELDAHLAAGKPPLGPLHGVPVSLKDGFKVKGYDASLGIAALAFNPAKENSVLVDCLLDAGAVLYCKTNVPQTLMALDSHNNVFGRTLNPLNTAVTAGGSSGGEGALLAMRGSILGVGTDVGGSIRIPAMCDGIYGFKPSWERIPYSGQQSTGLPGGGKIGLPSSAGPMAHSMRDIEFFFDVMAKQKPWERDADVAPMPWTSIGQSSSTTGALRIGIVRRDGLTDPLPPITRILDEVKAKLQTANIEVVEMDISALFSQCQALANAFFSSGGSNYIFDLLESAEEPLSPWLSGRSKRRNPIDLVKLQELHGQREALRKQFLGIWNSEQYGKIDAFVCPVAPHPVPPIDKWNAVSYTSSMVLLDYPAATLPVRKFTSEDMQGEVPSSEPLGVWDKLNRELWTNVDRKVYIGTPLCVQVVAPKLQEEKLVSVMTVMDNVLKGQDQGRIAAKL